MLVHTGTTTLKTSRLVIRQFNLNDVQVSQDKILFPLRVAILAVFLFYRYKFLSRVEDKNLYRLP